MANEEKQIILKTEGENEPKSYWSINKYGRYTWKHKWWVLGSTVVVGLVALLVTQFAVNPSKLVATGKYSYNLALTTENGVSRFLNGEIFDYSDILLESNLEAVKASKSDYSNINVQSLIRNNAISVSETKKEKDTDPTTYTISVKTKYFSDMNQTRSFVTDLINSVQDKSNEAIKSYTVDNVITAKFSSLEFDQQIITLSTQYSNVNQAYADLSETFGSSAKIGDKSLNDYINDFEDNYKVGSETIFSKLSLRIYQEGLAAITTTVDDKVESLKSQAENYKASIKKNITDRGILVNEREQLLNASIIASSSTEYTKRIVELSDEIAKVDSTNAKLVESLRIYGYTDGGVDIPTLTISDVNSFEYDTTKPYCQAGIIYKLENATDKDAKKAECDSFATELQNNAKKLIEDSETLNTAHHYLYSTYSNKANFYTTGVIQQSGGYNAVLFGGIFGLVALIASSLIVTSVEINKEKEADAKK